MLLVKAVIGQGDEVERYFREWKARQVWDDIDYGSYRLLPLLHWNLKRHAVDDPVMGRLMGIRRRTWVENQVALKAVSTLIEQLRSVGIETLLLKGAALILSGYDDHGLRPMNDLDLAVPYVYATDAVDRLLDLGWRPRVPAPHRSLAVLPGVAFDHPKGADIELDLHWNVMTECAGLTGDDAFWRRAERVTLHGAETRIPSPTDQLLHTCIHGVKFNEVPPLRWIADAAFVLRKHAGAIDWGVFIEETRARRSTLVVREAVTFLTSDIGLPMPTDLGRYLSTAPIDAIERLEYELRTRGSLGPLGNFPQSLANWVRRTQHQDVSTRLRELPSFMRDWWQLEPKTRLGPYLVRKVAESLSGWLFGHGAADKPPPSS